MILKLKHEIFQKFQSCQGTQYLSSSPQIPWLQPPILSFYPSVPTTPGRQEQISFLVSGLWLLGMLFHFLGNCLKWGLHFLMQSRSFLYVLPSLWSLCPVSPPKSILLHYLQIYFWKEWSENIILFFINLPVIQKVERKLHSVTLCPHDGFQLTFTPSSPTAVCMEPTHSYSPLTSSEHTGYSHTPLPLLKLLLQPSIPPPSSSIQAYSFFKASNTSFLRPPPSFSVRINCSLLLFDHSTFLLFTIISPYWRSFYLPGT